MHFIRVIVQILLNDVIHEFDQFIYIITSNDYNFKEVLCLFSNNFCFLIFLYLNGSIWIDYYFIAAFFLFILKCIHSIHSTKQIISICNSPASTLCVFVNHRKRCHSQVKCYSSSIDVHTELNPIDFQCIVSQLWSQWNPNENNNNKNKEENIWISITYSATFFFRCFE